MTITRRELANELKISIGGVDQYVRSGMPLASRYDALDWIVAHKQPQYGRNAHKGVSLARKLLREGVDNIDPLPHPGDAAIAIAEGVLAPFAGEIWQECTKLGERVVKLVEGVDDPEEVRAIARDEARKLLARLARMPIEAGNGRS